MDATVNIIVIVFIVSHAIIDLVNLVGILGVQPMQLKYTHNMKRCSNKASLLKQDYSLENR